MSIASYTIQEWLFNQAHGKFKYDLAESGVQFQHVKDISIDDNWCLDYSIDRGSDDLRKLITSQYKNDVTSTNAVVTHGAQEALYIFYRTLLQSRDHVITITPGWQQAWEVPRSIGCDVTLLEWNPREGFPVESLENSISSKTKLLILNNPCNPTGAVLNTDEWEKIISICKRNRIWILNDEEYLLDFSDSIINKYELSISVSSLSKIYGLPALRLGWAVSNNHEIIEKMVNYKRYTTVSNSLLLENIAKKILLERELYIERFNSYIKVGRPWLDKFSKLAKDKLELIPPNNTPYAWFNTKDSIDSSILSEQLLKKHQLLIMPAEVFGSKNGFRLTYARDEKLLEICLNIILDTLDIQERL